MSCQAQVSQDFNSVRSCSKDTVATIDGCEVCEECKPYVEEQFAERQKRRKEAIQITIEGDRVDDQMIHVDCHGHVTNVNMPHYNVLHCARCGLRVTYPRVEPMTWQQYFKVRFNAN